MSTRSLDATEKRTLLLLGLPTAALALAITVVTTYVPVAASRFLDSSVIIGGLIAIEGVLALWLPLAIGSWSDRLRTSIGGRLPLPKGSHGTLTGFYSLSRGIGTALGPLLAGIAIEVLHDPFSSSDGYAAMWLVCGATILLSVPALMRLRRLAEHIIDPA